MITDPDQYRRTVYNATMNRTAWVPYAWVCELRHDGESGDVIRALAHFPQMRAGAIATTNALHTMTLGRRS